MADGLGISIGVDAVIDTDEVTRGTLKHQQVVKIALGADNAFDTLVDSGQQLSANSVPVVIASDQTAVPVSAASLPLPTGASTLAEQQTQTTSLGLIDDAIVADNAGFADGTTKLDMAGYIFDEVAGTGLTENDAAAARINANRAQVFTLEDDTTRGRRLTITAANAAKVDGSGVTQPVSAASLPLPTGAATSALQTQPGVDIGDVTINNAAGASAVPIQDGGNSITVDAPVGTPVFARLSDGAVALTTTGGRLAVDPSGVTSPVSIAATVTVDSELPAAEAIADNLTNATNAPRTLAFGMVYDGATWDRLPGTSADGALVNLGVNNDVVATGTLTNNNAAPGATNLGVLPAVASALAPTYAEGTQVLLSTTLAGAMRISGSFSGSIATTVNQDAPARTEADTTAPLSETKSGDLRVYDTALMNLMNMIEDQNRRILLTLTSINLHLGSITGDFHEQEEAETFIYN